MGMTDDTHEFFFVLALISIVAQRYRRTAKLCVRISERQTGPLLEITESAVLVLIHLMPVAFGNTARVEFCDSWNCRL